MVLHVVLVLVLGLTLRLTPRQGAASQRTAEVGIVLKRQDGQREFYLSEAEALAGASKTTAAAVSLEELFDEAPSSDPSDLLPSPFAVIGPGALESGGVGTARGAENGPRGSRHALQGGKARTGVFGVEGEGNKFVYVFDRSGSMGGSGRNALRAAKVELIASLESLGDTHQFQIIFYNQQPRIFNLTGQPNKLCFATEQNKRMAAKFVGSITAGGSTEHELALVAAIKLQPDVIFFLTDADGADLYPEDLAKIRRMATGIAIHAIEFGLGPQTGRENFLVKLARDNGGRHGYVDISRLSPVRRP